MTDTQSSFGYYALPAGDGMKLSWAQALPRNWFGRRAALILRKWVLRKGYKTVDATVDSLKLRLYMQDNVSERKFLFLPQFFDAFERDLIRARLRGGVFVDIGANAGIYTMTAAAAVGPEGLVLSIEPNPAVLERLKYNMQLNGFQSRILIEQAGVSDATGTFDLMLDESNLGGSSLVSERSDKKISVQCYPLLDILKKHNLPRVDALKIDIEGAEDKALIPFFKTAGKNLHPGFIILENSQKQWAQDLPAVLRENGYNILQATRMNTVWEKT